MIPTLRDPVAGSATFLLSGLAIIAWFVPAAMGPTLAILAVIVLATLAYAWPIVSMVTWMVIVETTPEMWLSDLIGHHELIIAVLKGAGLVVIGLAALRDGARFDRFNPAFAFLAMFMGGVVHGFCRG